MTAEAVHVASLISPGSRALLEASGAVRVFAEFCRSQAAVFDLQADMLERQACNPAIDTSADDLLTTREAAELLKCHPSTLKRNGYPARRHGRALRYRRGDLLAHGAPPAASPPAADAPKLLSRGGDA